jgi:DME family drug/metabolite transporter
VATGLCGALLLGERLGRRWLVATALAVAGCAVLVTAGTAGTTGPSAGAGAGAVQPVGVGLGVLAGSCYGLYTTAARALLTRGVAPVPAMGATLGLGAVLLAPVLLAPVLLTHTSALAGTRSLLVLAWLGLVTTTGAYALFARGLRVLPAAAVGTLSLAEPLTAAALGLLVLHERPGPQAGAGALVLAVGLVLAATTPPPPVTHRNGHRRRRAGPHRRRPPPPRST